MSPEMALSMHEININISWKNNHFGATCSGAPTGLFLGLFYRKFKDLIDDNLLEHSYETFIL